MLVGQLIAFTVLGFLVSHFFTYFFHVLGHKPFFTALHRIHIEGHHRTYAEGGLVKDRYITADQPINFDFVKLHVAIVIAAATTGVTYYVISPPIVVLLWYNIVFALFTYLFSWFHNNTHIANSPVSRFRWFKKLKKLHVIHHKTDGLNGGEYAVKNYGTYCFLADRLFGTYLGKLEQASLPVVAAHAKRHGRAEGSASVTERVKHGDAERGADERISGHRQEAN